jgi:hypothetical protein
MVYLQASRVEFEVELALCLKGESSPSPPLWLLALHANAGLVDVQRKTRHGQKLFTSDLPG